MSEIHPTGPVARYRETLRRLDAQANKAILRGKPTMWAYFVDMQKGLKEWFGDIDQNDGAFAGAALALSQKAVRDCDRLTVRDAARVWALGVYARKILASWGAGVGGPVSLDWLRKRATMSPAEIVEVLNV